MPTVVVWSALSKEVFVDKAREYPLENMEIITPLIV